MVTLPDVDGEWEVVEITKCDVSPHDLRIYHKVEPKPMPEPESEGYFVSQLGNFLANEKWYLAAQMIYDQIKRSREP